MLLTTSAQSDPSTKSRARKSESRARPTHTWPLVTGSLLAIVGGSVGLTAGNGFGAWLGIGGLTALLYGHDRTGIKSLNLALGRGVHHEDLEPDRVDPDASERVETTQIDSKESTEDATVIPLRGGTTDGGTRVEPSVPSEARVARVVRPTMTEEDQPCPRCREPAPRVNDQGFYCYECGLPF